MSDIISKQLRCDLKSAIKDHQIILANIFDIGQLSDLKLQYHFDSSMDPRVSVKVTLCKRDEVFIENGIEISGGKHD